MSNRFIVHSTVVDDAYIYSEAAKAIIAGMVERGKVMREDELGVLVSNLRILSKAPRKLSRTSDAPMSMEFYDSTAVQGLSGAMDAAISLMPTVRETEVVLRVLGKFSSVGECAVAPKGTRSKLAVLIDIMSDRRKSLTGE